MVKLKIGKRIFYDKITGKVILDTGERQGDVIERTIERDFADYPELQGRSVTDTGVLELAYGERAEEFKNMGSYFVNPNTHELLIYPRLFIDTDKKEIPADGITVATITATLPDPINTDPIIFQARAGEYNSTPVEIAPQNGSAVFELCTEVPGDYTVTAKHVIYGQNKVLIKGVEV